LFLEGLREEPFAAFKLNVTSSVAVSTDVAGTIIKQAELESLLAGT